MLVDPLSRVVAKIPQPSWHRVLLFGLVVFGLWQAHLRQTDWRPCPSQVLVEVELIDDSPYR